MKNVRRLSKKKYVIVVLHYMKALSALEVNLASMHAQVTEVDLLLVLRSKTKTPTPWLELWLEALVVVQTFPEPTHLSSTTFVSYIGLPSARLAQGTRTTIGSR